MYGTRQSITAQPGMHSRMQPEFFTINRTTIDHQVERLEADVLDADKRHEEARIRGATVTARSAEDDWIKASDALTKYLATHPEYYRDRTV